MALVLCNNGEAVALRYLVNADALTEDLVLRLYQNDITPTPDSDVADFAEASGFGYAAKTLVGANWSLTPGNPTTADYPVQSFGFTGPLGIVYGAYITRASSNDLIFAERFSSPANIQNDGDAINITPSITAT